MKLHFIGTSHGVPEADRRLSCTLLEVNGALYFFDMGTDVVSDIRRLGYRVEDVRAVFVTHPHNDHMDGLVGFAAICNWYYKSAHPKVYLPREGFPDLINGWIHLTCSPGNELEYFVYQPGEVYSDENITVTAYPTKHCAFAHAFLIEAEGKKIVYTGDLQSPKVDFPPVAFEMAERGERLDLIVCEMAHVSPIEAAEVFDRLRPGRVIHNHAAPYRYEAFDQAAAAQHPYPIELSFDGMTAEL